MAIPDFEDLDDFFELPEFAEVITRDDTGAQFNGIFGHEVVQLNDTLAEVLSDTLTVTCKSSDVEDFTQESTLTIDGETYRVTSISDDKTGITTLQVYQNE